MSTKTSQNALRFVLKNTLSSLEALSRWMRAHTGPEDGTLDMVCAAQRAIEDANAALLPSHVSVEGAEVTRRDIVEPSMQVGPFGLSVWNVRAEHFQVPGFELHPLPNANLAETHARDLVNLILKDTRETFSRSERRLMPKPATLANWREVEAWLEDCHGAAHCYVDITEHSLLGDCPSRVRDEVRRRYGSDSIKVDDAPFLLEVDSDTWVSAWIRTGARAVASMSRRLN